MECKEVDGRISVEQNIRSLVEKYFEGTTSVEEERLLREYFAAPGPAPDDLLYARAMFGFFDEASRETMQMDTKVVTGMYVGVGEPAAAVGKRNSERHGLRGRLIVRIASVAAVAALAAVLGITMKHRHAAVEAYCYVNGVAVTDPEEAMEYTAEVMGFVSGSLNRPAELLRPVGELSRPLETLERLSRFADILENSEK